MLHNGRSGIFRANSNTADDGGKHHHAIIELDSERPFPPRQICTISNALIGHASGKQTVIDLLEQIRKDKFILPFPP